MNAFLIYQSRQHNTEIRIIKAGFSPYAAFLGAFWALYNRLWLLAITLSIFNAIISIFFANSAFFSIITTLEMICLGSFATDILEFELVRDGYMLSDVIVAKSEEEAELNYYNRRI